MSSRLVRKELPRGGHTYLLDGKKTAGVTTAINVMSKGDALIWWGSRASAERAVELANEGFLPPEEVVELATRRWLTLRDEGARRGTELHNLVEPLLRGEEVPESPDQRVALQVRSAVEFMDEWAFQPMLTETIVYNAAHGYAGTLDFVGTSPLYPGRVFLGDWKSNRSGIYPETALQLAAYANAEFYVDGDGNDHPVAELGITDHIALWLREEGYEVRPTLTAGGAFEKFLAALKLYQTGLRVNRYLLGDPLVVADDLVTDSLRGV